MSMRSRTLIALLGFGLLSWLSYPPRAAAGHFEGSDAAELARFEGQQALVPEFGRDADVIVSLPTLKLMGRASIMQGRDMVSTLLDHGVGRVFIMAPSSLQGNVLASDELFFLRRRLGARWSQVHVIPHETPGWMTAWARDWAPLIARTPEGAYRFLDFNYDPIQKADDATPTELAARSGLARISVPLYSEGGNLMVSGNGTCFLTDAIVEANAQAYLPSDEVYTREQITALLRSQAGCSDVRFFERMPFEPTGHIDMWAKFIAADQVIVSELGPEALARVAPYDALGAEAIALFLDERATDFAAMGYRVARVPMPTPILTEGRIHLRSYTNLLLVDDTAFVPAYREGHYFSPGARYRSETFAYPDVELIEGMEARAAAVLADEGIEAVFIDADRLIAKRGAIHCATMEIPPEVGDRLVPADAR